MAGPCPFADKGQILTGERPLFTEVWKNTGGVPTAKILTKREIKLAVRSPATKFYILFRIIPTIQEIVDMDIPNVNPNMKCFVTISWNCSRTQFVKKSLIPHTRIERTLPRPARVRHTTPKISKSKLRFRRSTRPAGIMSSGASGKRHGRRSCPVRCAICRSAVGLRCKLGRLGEKVTWMLSTRRYQKFSQLDARKFIKPGR